MNRCKRCGIAIIDDVAVCPVCRGALTKTDDGQNDNSVKNGAFSGYPDMGLLAYRKKLVMRIIFFVAFVAAIVLLVINQMTNQESRWSWIGVGAIVYGFFTYAYTFQPKVYHQTKIVVQGLLTMLLLFWIDMSLGFSSWSIDYGVPLVLLAMNGLVLVLMLARRKDWQSYALTQLQLFVMGAVITILCLLQVVEHATLSVIAIAVTDVILFGMLVIGSRKMTMELRCLFRA